MEKELVREVELSNGEKLEFWHDGEKGEIVHSYFVSDGHDDVDYEFSVVTLEEADNLME